MEEKWELWKLKLNNSGQGMWGKAEACKGSCHYQQFSALTSLLFLLHLQAYWDKKESLTTPAHRVPGVSRNLIYKLSSMNHSPLAVAVGMREQVKVFQAADKEVDQAQHTRESVVWHTWITSGSNLGELQEVTEELDILQRRTTASAVSANDPKWHMLMFKLQSARAAMLIMTLVCLEQRRK